MLLRAGWPKVMAHGAARVIAENSNLLYEFLDSMQANTPKHKHYKECERHLMRMGVKGTSLSYASGALAQFPKLIGNIFNENKTTE